MGSHTQLSLRGTGGFAEVWLCKQDSDGAHIAKKILLPTISAKGVERFIQEVRILSKLDHPNIVKVYETQLGTAPYWYTMPYYKDSLREELPRVIGNSPRTIKIYSAILDAVEYAHREGVIHRDLKPHNVMMNSDDDVVVTDFGISRILDAEGDRFTNTGAKLGSDLYMSPEQTSDAKHVDHRSDIYSLGRMLYEIFTERLNSSVQDLNRLPPNIAPLVERCTKYFPRDRFQSVSDLKDAWRAAHCAAAPDNAAEMNRLIAELEATPQVPGKAKELLEILWARRSDNDVIRDSVMQVPVEAIATMHSLEPNKVQALVSQFVDHVTSQTWGTSYTDRLGLRCGNLYMVLKDPVSRADLLYCALMLGAVGDRYNLLEVFSQLCQSVQEPAEAKVVVNRLKSVSPSVRSGVAKRLNLDDFDPRIAQLFVS